MPPAPRAGLLALAALLIPLLSVPVAAQAPPEDAGGGQTWAPASVGLRVGYDDNSSGTVAGAQLRVPVVPAGWLELVPSADVTFLTGLKEYQANMDAVYVGGSRSGGLYAGGGLALRNSIYGEDGERETRTGANLVLGLVTRGVFQGLPLGVQVEARWTFLDADFNPRSITLGANVPLWGWERARR